MKAADIQVERAKLVADARKLLDKADNEKRSLTAEETQEYERMEKDIEAKRKDIERRIKLEKEEVWAGESRGRAAADVPPGNDGKDKKGDERRTVKWGERYTTPREMELAGQPGSDEYRSQFRKFLSHGVMGSQLIHREFDEKRALQSDLPTVGGYLVPPTQMVAGLIQAMDNAVFIRQKATVTQVATAASLGAVSLDADPADPAWTTELAVGTEDSTMAFGKRELFPHPLAKYIKLSNKLIRQAANVESLVVQRLAYKMAVTHEATFMTGTGANQPLGIFTASALGISTSRDVSTDNTTTAITADGLINCKYSLKPQYQKTAEWVFHRDAVKMIRKLKDGNGQYLWAPGLGGTPDTLLDRPVNQSEYASNTFTTGLYVGIFGDLSFYYIADALDMQVQRIDQLLALTNQTLFISRTESDGMPVLEEAFARVKLG